MTVKRQVYLLDPQKIPPETIAVTFAKTSRSPQTFREIAAELSAEKSAEFHEKWVVGYGHASVAEHAVLHIAVENISRLAVEALESNRLASYTEKSTRYQKWDPDAFFIPPELEGHPLRSKFVQTCQFLFDAYQQALPAVQTVVEEVNPRNADESKSAWERRLRSKYVDVCRFLLPAASLANVGMTINARALEHAIRKMLSHPLAEVQQTGVEIKRAALETVPTLVKYANSVPYWQSAASNLTQAAAEISLPSGSSDWCQLISHESDAENRVLAAALYRFSGYSYAQCLAYLESLAATERERLAQLLLNDRDRFDIPLRELEYASYTFDLILDQGAYFELKRHRMMTQTPQPLTTRLGYALPRQMAQAGHEALFRQAMQAAQECFEEIHALFPHAASYIVPNAFNRRVLLECNWRSLDHFVALRTAPNAHFSLRRIAQRMASETRTATPLLGAYLRPNPDETWQEIENAYFTAVK
ncbi:predicted alternative thymidylate synthase [Longilinea arvoryzae]|uniref:Predicted alternative thymidylate synthase n=1 Tax=Longilinea arvoryzae TaxID=360412 RepID=A0A0S7BGC6_9CHLR|nr:FAD-dependent thymidylate synthase [Longilinea arvoryzae]GAP14084.1 predicted alternative thymidylate synthase [Longilinea arvoryzae]